MQTNQQTRQYQWRPRNAGLAILIYFALSAAGTALLGIPQLKLGFFQGLWMGFLFLCLIVICLLTEKSRWSFWKKTGFFIFAWIATAILDRMLDLLVMPYVVWLEFHLPLRLPMYLFAILLSFVASLPMLFVAFWQSELFVKEVS